MLSIAAVPLPYLIVKLLPVTAAASPNNKLPYPHCELVDALARITHSKNPAKPDTVPPELLFAVNEAIVVPPYFTRIVQLPVERAPQFAIPILNLIAFAVPSVPAATVVVK